MLQEAPCLVTPSSGICHTLTVQSSEALAITLSLCGHQAMSRTGPLCPATSGTSGLILPTYKKKDIKLNCDSLFLMVAQVLVFTLESGKTRKAPPPPDSTMTATNLGLTQQNVESQEDLDTRMLS